MITLNPRVDFVFKKLFGTEENKDLLIHLLNSIVSETDQVTDLVIKNPYNTQNFKNEKQTILDIKAQDTQGKWFNVEMQIIDQDYYAQRALYYWSRLYTEQLSAGSNYDCLKKTIGINILNFNCLPETDYHNVYHVKNAVTNERFFDHFEVHFIELEKYGNRQMTTLLDRWVTFLRKAGEYDRNQLPREFDEVPSIRKALEILETMNMNPQEREIYEARLKWLRDEEMAIKKAEKKGRAEGKIEGKLETARNMLLEGLALPLIIKITGLSEADISKLQLELNESAH